MKHALLAASLVLVGAAAAGCGGGDGGGDGAPADASTEDFCAAYTSLFTDEALGGAGTTPDQEAMVTAVKDWAQRMKDVGTPEGISDDARAGFELTMEEVEGLDAADFDEEALQDLDRDLSDEEQTQAEAFNTYLTDTCGNPFEELEPSDAPS